MAKQDTQTPSAPPVYWSPPAHPRTISPHLYLPSAIALVFLLLPLVAILIKVDMPSVPELLSTPAAQDALRLSIITSLSATALCLVVGTPLALFLSRLADTWPTRILRTLLTMPMVLPPVVAGLALMITWGRQGLLGQHFSAFGVDISYSTMAVVLAQSFVSLPFFLTSLEGTLRTRAFREEETATLLGASRTRTFLQVTLPLSFPGIMSASALACARSLGEFGATITFAGSLQGVTRTLPLEIYLQTETDLDLALALSLILIIAAFILMAFSSATGSWLVQRFMQGPQNVVSSAPASVGEAPAETSAAIAPVTGHSTRDLGRAPGGPGVTVSAHIPERNLDLELELSAGSHTVLTGPNGAGKSTLIDLLAGSFNHPNAQVKWHCANKPRLAVLPQNPSLFPHMTALSNIIFALRCQGVSYSEAKTTAKIELTSVGLSHLDRRRPGQLSGGQAQRVAVARALAINSEVFLLDEPFTGIDRNSATQIRSILSDRAKHCTLVMATHDQLDIDRFGESHVQLG